MGEQVLNDVGAGRLLLEGRRAAVIGSIVNDAGCLGRAVAVRLATEGAAVALLDRDIAAAAVVAKELNDDGAYAAAFSLDLQDEGQVAAIVGETEAWLHGIDLVVHLAAPPAAASSSHDQFAPAAWRAAVGAGLGGPILLARHAVPALRRTGSGALLLVGPAHSGGSLPDGVRMAGVHGLAVSLDRQLRPRGVRVVELTVPPEMLDPARMDADLADVRRAAATVAFAASDEGACIAGSIRLH